MSYTISLAPDVYTLLQERARQNHTSPDHLANEALRKYLGELNPAWRQEIDALIARVQERTATFAENEIEADIRAAADEVREARHARRRAG
jgi:predicted transcriptional regulator